MNRPDHSQDMIDLVAVERRAQEMRAEWTAQALRDACTWLRDHLHLGKAQSPSA